MELEQALLARRSVRKFLPDKIDDETINKLLYFAMCAPSACNKKPWEFYVIKSADKLQEVQKASMFSNHNAPLAIVVAGNLHKALPFKMAEYWIQDCSSAITHILLEATNLGLGSLWCGLHPQKGAEEHVRKVLNEGKHIVPLGLILLGYPAESPEPRSQFDEKKVHFI
jgi:nitroreductase